MLRTAIVLFAVATSVKAATCGGSGVPFRFEVLPSGYPVLGCASPQCFGAENGGRDILHDAQFNPGQEGEDGFFREGDMARVRSRYRDAPGQQAQCPSGFGSTSCSSSTSWVGGFIAGDNGDLQLQCCRYDGLKYATEVGRPVVHAGEVYSGGEVIRDGRQTGFDLISNVKKITGDDGSIAYELTVTRMNCLPDPPEMENDVEINGESDISRILDKVSEPSQQGTPTEQRTDYGGSESPTGNYNAPQRDSYVQGGGAQYPPQQAAPQQQYVEQDKYVQVGEQVIPVTQPGYYYPVASGIPACFTSDTMVETPSGFKRMDELKIGDLVLTAETNTTSFTRVNSWLHRLPETTASFIRIEGEDGSIVKLTPQHFIFKVDCDRVSFNTEMIYAEEMTVGDCVYTQGVDRLIHPTRVSSLSVVEEKGVYAPMTDSGDLIANNVYASCHNVVKASTLSHTFLNFASSVQRSMRSFFGGEETGHLPPTAEFFLHMVDYLVPHKF